MYIPIKNHFAASTLFSVCSAASYSFILRCPFKLIHYTFYQPSTHPLDSILQRLEICLATASTPIETVIRSSENGQPTIRGLPKRHSLRQDDAPFIALTIYRHHATRYIIAT